VTSAQTAPAHVDVELADAWTYGRGILHGGHLLETIAAAALEHTAHPHVVSVSAVYAAAPSVGAATIEVEPVREGRTVASLRARLLQDGAPKIDALVTAGTVSDADVAPLRLTSAPPDLPPPEECVGFSRSDDEPRNGIQEQLETRMDPATAGFVRLEPGGGAEVRGWIRSRTGRPNDPLFMLTVADALPPVTVELGIGGWVPTVELTVHVRGVPAPGWLACVQRGRLLSGGWLDEDCEVWDSTGRLVCQARQLARYREPRA
jgi:acyl-coenzyme A thioesterase PaaI-like protein